MKKWLDMSDMERMTEYAIYAKQSNEPMTYEEYNALLTWTAEEDEWWG